jgi:trimethylamine:corrinoid methyltransferase-like protein
MRTYLQVLSEDERAQVHERTLSILANTGVRVDTS